MSKYKGQHGGKKGKKNRARPSPPPFRAMPERNRFFLCEVVPNANQWLKIQDGDVDFADMGQIQTELSAPKQWKEFLSF